MLVLRWHPPERTLALRWIVPAGAIAAAPQPPGAPALAAVIGPPGPPGAGGNRYVHTQASAASTWTVNHNLAAQPAGVSVRTVGGVEVEAQVTHVSANQLIVTFAAPASGSVVII